MGGTRMCTNYGSGLEGLSRKPRLEMQSSPGWHSIFAAIFGEKEVKIMKEREQLMDLQKKILKELREGRK
jgi:hypothetical protein